MSVIAVDVGGSSYKVAEYEGAERLWDTRIPYESRGDFERLLVNLEERIAHPSSPSGVHALGLALPGVVDQGGVMRSAPEKVPYLVGRDLPGELADRLGVPAVVDNDARAAARGECVSGAGMDAEVLLVVSLGTGIGTAVVIRGEALRDSRGYRGILGGHQKVVPAGPACTCGGRGCWEAVASGWALSRVIQELRPTVSRSSLSDGSEFEEVLTRAAGGDGLACMVREHYARWWAIGIANICMTIAPDRVVVTGGLAAGADDVLPRLRLFLRDALWEPDLAPDIRIADDVWSSATRGIAHLAQALKPKE